MLLIILIIAIIILILINCLKSREKFVVPQNSDKIDETKLAISDNIQRLEENINENYNKDVDLSNLIEVETLNDKFTLILRKFIINEIKYDDLMKSQYTIDLSVPFKDIKYKFNTEKVVVNNKMEEVDLNEIILKFNTVMSVNNLYKFGRLISFSIKNISITIKISSFNQDKLLVDNNPVINYLTNYSEFLKYEILDINIEKEGDEPLFKAQDKLNQNYYKITNELNLLTPFTSSYDEMLITEKMRLDYENSLPDISDIQVPIYKPFL
jgi:hypothetical protein